VSRRLLVIALLATAVALLTMLDRPVGHAGVVTSAAGARPEIPGVASSGSTWYCAAGSVGSGEGVSHDVVVANPTDRSITARLTVVVARSVATPDAATTTVAPTGTNEVVVGARATAVVPIATPGSSVMVELNGVGAVVSHRLVADSGFDEASCATAPGRDAYFPTANTDTAHGASAQLWLFNPFAADASVDVHVATEEGVRTPGALRGLVVAGRSSVVVELGRIVQTRDQFAMSVGVRDGVVIAELSQLEPTTGALALTPGATRASTRLAFADGRSGDGVAERYVVYNPGGDDASVLVSVVPFDTDAGSLPEKFDLSVPARRYTTLDLQDQARVPTDRPHWVRIESVNGVGVVVERIATITAAGSPFGGKAGTAVSIGQPAMAARWIVPWADRAAESTSVLAVVNPSTDTIAKVTLRRMGAGTTTKVGGVVELAEGGGSNIDLGAAGAEPASLIVDATSPVIVERRVLAASGGDVAVVPGVARRGDVVALPSMSQTTSAEIGGH